MWKQPNKLINIEWITRREKEGKNQFWMFRHLFDHEKIIYTKFRAISFTFSLFASKRKHWNDLDRFMHYSLVWIVLLRIWNAMAVRLIYKRNHLAARFTVHKTSTGSQHEYFWFVGQEFLFLTENFGETEQSHCEIAKKNFQVVMVWCISFRIYASSGDDIFYETRRVYHEMICSLH